MSTGFAAPLTIRAGLLSGLDRIADALGLFSAPSRPEDLTRLACRRSGLDDFGDWSFEEPLAVLLRAYEQEANLGTFGRVGVRWDMVRFLSNLLRLRDEEKKAPGIRDEPIDRPIFILGLPRSGTTFLHNLMASDPANRVPRCWETIYPYPVTNCTNGADDPRAEMVARRYEGFLILAPELPSLHPLNARAAQECIEITGHVIRSMRFDTTHYVPSYARWLDDVGHSEAYRFHKRFLQHLQHQNGRGQWVLKSPDHIFAFDAIQEVYPDARFVFVHRDPMKVLPSVARLTEVLRQPFTRRVDRLQVGRQVSDRWAQGARLLIEAAERLEVFPQRVFHVRYKDLVKDPLGEVTAIYSHFNLILSDDARARLQRLIDERPNGGYGQNIYHLEDYGLDSTAERERYSAYVEYFRMKPEDIVHPMTPRSRVRVAGANVQQS